MKEFEVCNSQTNYIMHTKLYNGGDYLKGDPNPLKEKLYLVHYGKIQSLGHILGQFYTNCPLSKKLFNQKNYDWYNKVSKHLSKIFIDLKFQRR